MERKKIFSIQKNTFLKSLILLLVLFFGFILFAEQWPAGIGRMKTHEVRLVMGTIVQIDVYHSFRKKQQLKKVLGKVWKRIEDIGWRMYGLDEGGDIYRLNHANGASVQVGADTYTLLQAAPEYATLTKGAFDITVWPLIKLWRKAEKEKRFPTSSEIQAAKKKLGVYSFEFLPAHCVRVTKEGVQVDLSGFAKGFAVDEAARILRDNGFFDFLIDAGGDIYASGHNAKKKQWRIGIRDPRRPQRLIEIVEVSNKSVTTSGDYEQNIEIKGKIFSHIINPLNGYPLKEGISATVIAPTAQMADMLATALCVLQPSEGLSLIASLGPGYAAVVFKKKRDGELQAYCSQNWGKYLKETLVPVEEKKLP